MRGGKNTETPLARFRRWIVTSAILLVGMAPLVGCGTGNVQKISSNKKITSLTQAAVVRVIAYDAETYTLAPALAQWLGTSQTVQEVDGGMGSGSVITPDGYIVTNAHVVQALKTSNSKEQSNLNKIFLNDVAKALEKRDQQAGSNVAQQWYDYAVKTTQTGSIQKHATVIMPGGDKYSFDIKSYGAPIGQGKDVAVIKIDATNLPIITIDASNSVQTEDSVLIAGYPGAADLQGFLSQKSQLESSYTNGTIAAIKSADSGPIIQFSASINHGNSGGPVLSASGQLIGMATATSTGATGIGWVVPASTILEYVHQAGASYNHPGPTTSHFETALKFYWQGHYKKALPEFQQVQRLYPKFYKIQDYLTKTQQAIDSGKNRIYWPDYRGLLIGGGAAVVVVIGGGIALVLVVLRKKNKKRRNDQNTK